VLPDFGYDASQTNPLGDRVFEGAEAVGLLIGSILFFKERRFVRGGVAFMQHCQTKRQVALVTFFRQYLVDMLNTIRE
jgi:hypothetical protein